MLSFNPHCFTSLEVTYILNFSQFSHSTWKLPLPLGYTCTVPRACQAHSCTLGQSFAYSTTRLEKAMLSYLEEKRRFTSSHLQTFWFKVFQAQVQDTSQLFLMLYIFFCIDCVLVTDPWTQSLRVNCHYWHRHSKDQRADLRERGKTLLVRAVAGGLNRRSLSIGCIGSGGLASWSHRRSDCTHLKLWQIRSYGR